MESDEIGENHEIPALLTRKRKETEVSLSENTGQDQKIEVGCLPLSFHSIKAIKIEHLSGYIGINLTEKN